MKLIFLDIDGVLNNVEWCDIVYKRTPNDLRSKSFDTIYTPVAWDPSCVHNLFRIIEATDANIVVSSTWRVLPEHIKNCLYSLCPFLSSGHNAKEKGLKEIHIVGMTSSKISNGPRGMEIKQYLKNTVYDVESYVIIDDNSDMLPEQNDNFVQTDPLVGLTAQNADQAISILNKIQDNKIKDENDEQPEGKEV